VRILILLFCCVFLWPALVKAEPVSVIVDIREELGESSEYMTVQRARNRAVIEGIDRLPSIIIGKEQLQSSTNQDDVWSLDIKAVIATQAKSSILSLVWNEERTAVSVKVEVSLDYQSTLAMIHGIQSSLSARSKLKELYAQFIDNIESQASLSDLQLLRAEAEHVIFNHFNALSHDEALQLEKSKEQAALTVQSYRDYEELLKLWNSLSIEVVAVRNGAVIIDVRASYAEAPAHVSRRFCIARNKESNDVILSGLRFIHPDARLVILADGDISEAEELLWANRRVPTWKRDTSEFQNALRTVGGNRNNLPRYGYSFVAGELGLNLDAILANPGLLLERMGGC